MDLFDPTPLIPAPSPLERTIFTLQRELAGIFQVSSITPRAGGEMIRFAGKMLLDSDQGYDDIRRRFEYHGYTPLLRREAGEDVVLAVRGVVEQGKTGNPWLNLLLLLITILTTLSAGAGLGGISVLALFQQRDVVGLLWALWAGVPFGVTLLGILGVHELGHYVAARWHRVAATLPYFIPMPIGGLGTLGAFISIKSPMKNRKVLFDIGLAGPIAGFVVALPLLLIGLYLSAEVPFFTGGLTLRNAGTSILVNAMVSLFKPLSAGTTLAMHPVFFAAWFGVLITGINLLPVGQLDGGHVAYAMFGRRAHTLAWITFGALIVAGALLSWNWYMWAFFVLIAGLRHPPPLNDVAPLDPPRLLAGWLTALLFVLIVVPAPFG